MIVSGTGTYNGRPGATITAVFSDAGTSGDGVQITIKDSQGRLVLEVAPTTLTFGNQKTYRVPFWMK